MSSSLSGHERNATPNEENKIAPPPPPFSGRLHDRGMAPIRGEPFLRETPSHRRAGLARSGRDRSRPGPVPRIRRSPPFPPLELVRFGDAVFNLGRASLLCAAWATGRWDLLSWGMDDRLHQPYRSSLFPGGKAILERIRELPGCVAVAISGSGPTMVALVRGSPGAVASAMCRTFSEHDVPSQFFVLRGSSTGAAIERAAGGLPPAGGAGKNFISRDRS